MVATNDVVSVDRFVRVITSTMSSAYHYKENWPVHCLAMLESVARELKPLLKTFGRPLAKELEISIDPTVIGIVLKEWAFIPDKPRYVVCYAEGGWVTVRKPDNHVLYHGSRPDLLADIIGDGIGGASLFIDACAYAVEELFRKRREQLDELEQGCLLRRMYEACDRSKWPDAMKFINGLE